MKDNKSYDYTNEFSDIIHTARFINAAELSGLFFSAPKWITILMKFRNVMVRPLGSKKEIGEPCRRPCDYPATTISRQVPHEFPYLL